MSHKTAVNPWFNPRNREHIRLWISTLNKHTALPLDARYNIWLNSVAMDDKGRLMPGLTDAPEFLVKDEDLTKWVKDVDLYAPRPELKRYYSKADLAEYDFSVSYYFLHRAEVHSRVRRMRSIDQMDPTDRPTREKNPGEGHVDFIPEMTTRRMVTDAVFLRNLRYLQHKITAYESIIIGTAIRELGLDAEAVIDWFLCRESRWSDKIASEADKDRVTQALEELEYAYCESHGVAWESSILPWMRLPAE